MIFISNSKVFVQKLHCQNFLNRDSFPIRSPPVTPVSSTDTGWDGSVQPVRFAFLSCGCYGLPREKARARERENARASECVCVSERESERGREGERVCVCVCEREREREREREGGTERARARGSRLGGAPRSDEEAREVRHRTRGLSSLIRCCLGCPPYKAGYQVMPKWAESP